jgi:hypothetical protein
LKTTAGKTVLVLTTVNAGSVTTASLRASWTAFASIRPLIGNGTPKPWRLAPLADARAFVDDDLRLGPPPAWRDMYYGFAR